MSVYLKNFIVPFVVLILVATVSARYPNYWDDYATLMVILPYVLFICCAGIAYFLMQYVYAYSCVLFTCFYLLIQLHLQAPLVQPDVMAALLYGTIVLPLLVMCLVLWGNKSPKTTSSILIMAASTTLVWLPYVLSSLMPVQWISEIPAAILNPITSGISLNLLMLVTVIPVLIFTLLLYYLNPTLILAHWIVGLFTTLVMLSLLSVPLISALTYSCLAVLFLVALFQEAFQLAYIDELTEIPGRKALEKYLLNLPRRYSIAMLDIDHFKQFNDRHGHDVGDQVLRMVAKKIEAVTGNGRSFRYGGEEFTVVFPNRTPEQAFEHLEKVRLEIEAYRMQLRSNNRPENDKEGKQSRKGGGGQQVRVTISMGVAGRCMPSETAEDVIKLADKALYAAKKAGRNRIALHKHKQKTK